MPSKSNHPKSAVPLQMFQHGITAVELTIAIAVLAVLASLAAPSFRNQLAAAQITSSVNTFLSDLRFARSEAIKRGSIVVMCRSDAPEAARPSCGSGSGPGTNGWVSGWIIFEDRDKDSAFNGTDEKLRVQAAIPAVDAISELGTSSSTRFIFTALGRLKTVSSATSLQFGGGNYTNAQQRVVCVSLTGRGRVVGDGTSSCRTNK